MAVINVTATEIPQCPPKDARREILDIDICPDDAVSLHYHIRVKNIHEHYVLPAYNLHMTTSGKFRKRGKLGSMVILHSLLLKCKVHFFIPELRLHK